MTRIAAHILICSLAALLSLHGPQGVGAPLAEPAVQAAALQNKITQGRTASQTPGTAAPVSSHAGYPTTREMWRYCPRDGSHPCVDLDIPGVTSPERAPPGAPANGAMAGTAAAQ